MIPPDVRDFQLDDGFWRDAITALRTGEMDAFRSAWPACAELVEELVRDARRDGLLAGGRLATPGKNGRLFLLLAAALVARSGARTLYLDLSPELRWLEQLLGENLKEGLVDHLEYDVPVERCLRETALPGFSVMTGGAYFLAGSPLEDAPAFRAALERLRNGRDAVVVAFPPPADTADAAGMAALCDALLTVEEGGVEAPLAGNERAVVRLVGDPQAAWDLARLSEAFLGPLPALLAGVPGRPAANGGTAEEKPDVEDEEEIEFLRAFEGAAATRRADRVREGAGIDDGWGLPPPVPPRRPAPDETAPAEEAEEAEPPEPAGAFAWPADRPERTRPGDGVDPPSIRAGRPIESPVVAPPPRRRRTRAGLPRGALLGVAALLVAGLLGAGGWWIRSRAKEADFLERWPVGDSTAAGGAAEAGVAVPLSPVVATPAAGDSAAGGSAAATEAAPDSTTGTAVAAAAADSAAADSTAAAPPAGRSAPYSVHVGSYQSAQSGERVVDRIRQAGYTAFLSPVSLPGKGLWQRVFVGAYADSSSARAALDRLLGAGVVEEGVVRQTPLAFAAGTYDSRDAAVERRDALARAGVSAYVVGDGPWRVWAGAFKDEGESRVLAHEMRAANLAATLTSREE